MKWIRPNVKEVTLQDAFWSSYTENVRSVMLPYVFRKFEETGYLGYFDALAGNRTAEHSGPPFSDGLVLESLRGACDFLAKRYDAALDASIDRLIARITAAFDVVGEDFLSTKTLMEEPKERRFGRNGGDIIIQHDLYNHGALIEAAVAHYNATGKTSLLRIAVQAANCISETIGESPKWNVIPGHSLPEEAFIKLYRLFRDCRALDGFADAYRVIPENYLALARFFYENRGNYAGRTLSPRFSREYNQDHATFARQKTAVGHAVRATLCYTGAAALCYELDGSPLAESYLEALSALWRNVTDRKLHISGGIGTRHDIEGFDGDYRLPNNAYLETCAAIGFAFWAGEMGLLEPKAEYFDGFERALYNNILAAIGEDFTHYFYQNPLESPGNIARWDWHVCPCCPPMLLKLYGCLGTYVFSHAPGHLALNLYIGAELSAGGIHAVFADGKLTVQSEKPLALRIRIPDYGKHFALTLNGAPLAYTVENGYACVEARIYNGTETIGIAFDTPIRRIAAHPAVADDQGKVAVQKGPFLYCAEGADNGGSVDFTLSAQPELAVSGDTVTGKAADGRDFTLIPYYRWARRPMAESNPMAVWFPQDGALPKAETDALYYEI